MVLTVLAEIRVSVEPAVRTPYLAPSVSLFPVTRASCAPTTAMFSPEKPRTWNPVIDTSSTGLPTDTTL